MHCLRFDFTSPHDFFFTSIDGGYSSFALVGRGLLLCLEIGGYRSFYEGRRALLRDMEMRLDTTGSIAI